MLPQLIKLRDMARDGRKVMLPLVDREIPLVADEWAKPELGTGCVKITPAHDPNDYEVGQRQNLPMINILNPDGTLNDNAGAVPGPDGDGGPRAAWWPTWRSSGLVEQDRRPRDRPGPLRPLEDADRAVPGRSVVREDGASWPRSAMDAVTDGRVKIIPERYAKGYLDWLGEKRDWPISRQLWWGHRIPIWYCQDRPAKPT